MGEGKKELRGLGGLDLANRIYEIGTLVNQGGTLDDVIRAIVQRVLDETDSDYAGIALVDVAGERVNHAWGLVSLGEFLIFRKKEADPINFGLTRVASTLFYCWTMFILFFTPPAYYGKYPNDLIEIVSANIVLYATSVFAGIFEFELARIKLSQAFRVAVIILTLIFMSLLVIYSFRLPWFDVFAIPPGWE